MEIVITVLLCVLFFATAGSMGCIASEYDSKHGGLNGLATLLLFMVSLSSLVSISILGESLWK